MKRFPVDVEGALVSALGAYIRATPAHELPGSLRPYQGFRPAALKSRAAGLLDKLDNGVVRAKVLEWVEAEPPASARTLELLRLATQRPEGWEDSLAARSSPAPVRRTTAIPKPQTQELERERAKVSRAREDLRSAKDASRARLEVLRARIAALTAELEAVRLRLRAAEADLRATQAAAGKQAAAHERELRRVRRSEARARSDNDVARRELKAMRKEAAALGRRVSELEESAAPAQRAQASMRTETQRPPRRRTALPVPKGLFEDSPEALDSWLSKPGVHLLVDGYNVAKAEGGYGEISLGAQRKRVIDEVARLVRAKKARGTIVFDGSEVPPGDKRPIRGAVNVAYSSSHEIADDHLVALLDELPNFPVIAVTNDRELQRRAAAKGATIATSGQLLALFRR